MANKVILSWLGVSPKDKIINVALIIIFIVVLYFGGKYLYNKLKSVFTSTKKELTEELEKGTKLTYSDSEYQNMSDTLYSSMKGLGTDEESIYSVFYKMVNKADVLKLVLVFGIKESENLSQWLKDDLSGSGISKINSILSSKNIDYSF
ncbi:MAG: hypothetical protein LBG80_00265 [Bacteroidales bacterium]|jgi:uncharacterized protein YpmB|nr:hypothetical protein [Bacteroidales bacterium]